MFLAGCDEHDAEAGDVERNRPVLVTSISYANRQQSWDFSATITPRITADLGFRVGGKVLSRLVEVGQKVKAGDRVAVLDSTDLSLQVEQARADLASAKTAQTTATKAEKRAKALLKSGTVAQAYVDNATNAAEEARGRYKRSEHAFELARNALGYTTLHADAAGTVTQTMIEPGQVVAAGQAVVRVAQSGELEALVSFPETFNAAEFGDEAKLVLWAEPGRAYRARLRELSPSADPTTRMFSARFSILDADGAVAIGKSATLTLMRRDAGEVARIPQAAIFSQGKETGVWRVDDGGHVRLVPVTVLRLEADNALISGSLREGDTIVALGVQKLDPALPVKVIRKID